MPTQPLAAPRTLNLVGTEVARIGLGTNRLTSTPENQAFLREAIEAGLRHIDTAHVYSSGDSERAIGEALSPNPEGLVIATKGGYSGSGGREAVRAQIEQSLESLRTEAIDLYYLHRVDPGTPVEESLGAIAEYREAGRIKEVGISAVDVNQIEASRRVVPIAAVQNHYTSPSEPPTRSSTTARSTASSSFRTTRSRGRPRRRWRRSRGAATLPRGRLRLPGCCGAHP